MATTGRVQGVGARRGAAAAPQLTGAADNEFGCVSAAQSGQPAAASLSLSAAGTNRPDNTITQTAVIHSETAL